MKVSELFQCPLMYNTLMENIDEIVSYTSKKPIFDLNFRGKPVIFRGTQHGPQILIGRRAIKI